MIIFAILQLINVVLQTLKVFLTVKSNRHIGAISNIVAYTFYAGIVKQISNQELWFVLLTTALANFIGFYLADFIFSKTQKDKILRITATHTGTEEEFNSLYEQLENNKISFSMIEFQKGRIFDIYSYSKKENNLVKVILSNYQIKYSVIELSKRL